MNAMNRCDDVCNGVGEGVYRMWMDDVLCCAGRGCR